IAAVDSALEPDPDARPRASALAADLRNSLRTSPARERRAPHEKQSPATDTSRNALARRFAPIGLAVVAAVLGATLLPFWPPALVIAIALGAGFATWLDPRIGLAVALAAPVFPLGNYAQSAALLYGVFALAWLALSWRDARWGLLFVCGPLLAGAGLLALVPLAVQPARGSASRAAQAGVAVLSALLVAGVAGERLPLVNRPAESPGIGPLDPVGHTALTVWATLAAYPVVLAGVAAVAFAAGILPWARRRSRYGVAVVGAVLTAAAIAVGAGVASTIALVLAWTVAAAVAAALHRPRQ
ncbi:MAG: hypothetical protein ABI783_00140, partial [Actinomycetota bacterium]